MIFDGDNVLPHEKKNFWFVSGFPHPVNIFTSISSIYLSINVIYGFIFLFYVDVYILKIYFVFYRFAL